MTSSDSGYALYNLPTDVFHVLSSYLTLQDVIQLHKCQNKRLSKTLLLPRALPWFKAAINGKIERDPAVVALWARLYPSATSILLTGNEKTQDVSSSNLLDAFSRSRGEFIHSITFSCSVPWSSNLTIGEPRAKYACLADLEWSKLFPNLRSLSYTGSSFYDATAIAVQCTNAAHDFFKSLPRELESLEIRSAQPSFHLQPSVFKLFPPALTRLALVSDTSSRDQTMTGPERLNAFRLWCPKLKHLEFSFHACFDQEAWDTDLETRSSDPTTSLFPDGLETLLLGNISPFTFQNVIFPFGLTTLGFCCRRLQGIQLSTLAPPSPYSNKPTGAAEWAMILDRVQKLSKLQNFLFEPEIRAYSREGPPLGLNLLVPSIPKSVKSLTINVNWIKQETVDQMGSHFSGLSTLKLIVRDMIVPTCPGLKWNLPHLTYLSGPGTEYALDSVKAMPKTLTYLRGYFPSTEAVEALHTHLLRPLFLVSSSSGPTHIGPLCPAGATRLDAHTIGSYWSKKWPALQSLIGLELWSRKLNDTEIEHLRGTYASLTELDLRHGFECDTESWQKEEFWLAGSDRRLKFRSFSVEHLKQMSNLTRIIFGSLPLSSRAGIVECIPPKVTELDLGSAVTELTGPPNLPNSITRLAASINVAIDTTRVSLPMSITELDLLHTRVLYQAALWCLPKVLVKARFTAHNTWNDLILHRFIKGKPHLLHLTLHSSAPILVASPDFSDEDDWATLRRELVEIPRTPNPMLPAPDSTVLELLCVFQAAVQIKT